MQFLVDIEGPRRRELRLLREANRFNFFSHVLQRFGPCVSDIIIVIVTVESLQQSRRAGPACLSGGVWEFECLYIGHFRRLLAVEKTDVVSITTQTLSSLQRSTQDVRTCRLLHGYQNRSEELAPRQASSKREADHTWADEAPRMAGEPSAEKKNYVPPANCCTTKKNIIGYDKLGKQSRQAADVGTRQQKHTM